MAREKILKLPPVLGPQEHNGVNWPNGTRGFHLMGHYCCRHSGPWSCSNNISGCVFLSETSHESIRWGTDERSRREALKLLRMVPKRKKLKFAGSNWLSPNCEQKWGMGSVTYRHIKPTLFRPQQKLSYQYQANPSVWLLGSVAVRVKGRDGGTDWYRKDEVNISVLTLKPETAKEFRVLQHLDSGDCSGGIPPSPKPLGMRIPCF